MLKSALVVAVVGVMGCSVEERQEYACPAPLAGIEDGRTDVPLTAFREVSFLDGSAPELTGRCGVPVWRFGEGASAVMTRLDVPAGCSVRVAAIVVGGAAGEMSSRIIDGEGRELGVFSLTARDSGARDLSLRAGPSSIDSDMFLEIRGTDHEQELHSVRVSFVCRS
jgi:hypothetical protein